MANIIFSNVLENIRLSAVGKSVTNTTSIYIIFQHVCVCVCLSVRTFLNKVGKLQAILIIEANN
jgi:hypothetical protein